MSDLVPIQTTKLDTKGLPPEVTQAMAELKAQGCHIDSVEFAVCDKNHHTQLTKGKEGWRIKFFQKQEQTYAFDVYGPVTQGYSPGAGSATQKGVFSGECWLFDVPSRPDADVLTIDVNVNAVQKPESKELPGRSMCSGEDEHGDSPQPQQETSVDFQRDDSGTTLQGGEHREVSGSTGGEEGANPLPVGEVGITIDPNWTTLTGGRRCRIVRRGYNNPIGILMEDADGNLFVKESFPVIDYRPVLDEAEAIDWFTWKKGEADAP